MQWMFGGGMGVGGWLLMSIVWLAVAVLIVWAVAQVFPRPLSRSEIDRDR